MVFKAGTKAAAPLIDSLKKVWTSETPVAPSEQPTPDQVLQPVEQPQPTIEQRPDSLTPELGPVGDGMIPEPEVEPPVDPAKVIPEADDRAAEAKQFMDTGLEGYDTTASWQPNFNTITTDEDSQAVIAGLAEKYSTEIDEARRGVVHDEQLHAMAQELGADPKFISGFLERQTGQAVNAETIIASRHVLHESGRKLKTLAAKVMDNNATDAEKMEFHKQWDFHRQFMAQFMGARAEIGRALRSYGTPLGSQQFQLARQQEVLETQSKRFNLYEVAEQVLNTDDFAGLNKVVKNQAGGMSKGGAAMVEWFVSSILSGVKTHIVNTSGNAIMTMIGPVETALAARMGRAAPDSVIAGEASAQMFGLLSAFRQGLHVAMKVAKTGEPYQGVAKFETPFPKAISGEALGLKGPWGFMADVTGTVVRAPLERVMGPIDGFFMHLNESAKISQLAFREASQRRITENLSDDEFLTVLGELIENPPQHIREAGVDYSLYNMGATPLGETGRKWQAGINSNAIAKIIVPFIRTPTNLFKMAFADRSALGLLSRKVRDDIQGKNGPEAAQYARARMTFGSMLAATVAAYAGSGLITGTGPSNPDARRALMATGWRPRSIVTTDKDGNKTYVSYDRTEPLGYILGTVADLHEWSVASKYDSYDVGGADEVAAALVMAISENTVNKTFVTGIRDLMAALTSSPTQESDLRSFVSRTGGGFVPYSGALRDYRKIQDPYMREAFTILDKMRNQVPYLSENLPPRLDVFGEPIKYEQTMNPWFVSEEVEDPVIQHVGYLVEVTQGSVVTMPKKNIYGISLTNEEYHDYLNLSRNTVELDGLKFKDALGATILSEGYQAATPTRQVEALKNVQQSFDEEARRLMMLPENDRWRDLQSRMAEKLIDDAQKKGGDEMADSVRGELQKQLGF